jgi:MMP 1-O-methyltransferase
VSAFSEPHDGQRKRISSIALAESSEQRRKRRTELGVRHADSRAIEIVLVTFVGSRCQELLERALSTPGFFGSDEGEALFAVARRAARIGPIVEIGSYLGRSTLFLAAAVAAEGTGVVFSVDHHRGSEEMQPGWPDHDAALFDPATRLMDSLPHFRNSIKDAGTDDIVVCVVGESSSVARHWRRGAGLVFIDGGHGELVCWSDYLSWAPRVAQGGFLAFHDVFDDPNDGGRPPFECFCDAVASGRFVEDVKAGKESLRVLVASGVS